MSGQDTWGQLALLSYLASKVGGSGKLGKKAFQKYIYLLQELGKVPSPYKFRFYTYGPYSSDLAGDLDVANSLRAIDVTYDGASNAYSIQVGPEANDVLKRGEEFLSAHKKSIDQVLSQFSDRLAKDLELTSTIVYLLKHCYGDVIDGEDALIDSVIQLKPKYTKEEVSKSLAELKALHYFDQLAHA